MGCSRSSNETCLQTRVTILTHRPNFYTLPLFFLHFTSSFPICAFFLLAQSCSVVIYVQTAISCPFTTHAEAVVFSSDRLHHAPALLPPDMADQRGTYPPPPRTPVPTGGSAPPRSPPRGLITGVWQPQLQRRYI